MKQQLKSSFQQLTNDRTLLVVLTVFLVGCLGTLLYLAFSVHASELQLVVHYTSYGTTNFYRDKWYYLLSFAGFIIILAISQICLTYKILNEKGRDAALAFAWLGVALVVITAATIYQVLRIAALT